MFKEIGNQNVHYEIWGKGEPVVLIHGGQCRLESWRDMIPMLEKEFKVYAYDVRGHGQTVRPPDVPLSQEQWAQDLYDFMQSFGLKKAALAGWSMGGGIALTFAVRHPEMASHIILFGAGSPLVPQSDRSGFDERRRLSENGASGEEIMEKTYAFSMNAFSKYSLNENPHAVAGLREDLAFYYDKPYSEILERAQAPRADIGPKLKDILCPTLIVVGDSDARTPVEMSESLNKAIPNSYMKVVANCGHYYSYEHPEVSSRSMINFLKAF